MASRYDFIHQANAEFIEQQYARFREDPHSVPEEWALFFAGFELSGTAAAPAAAASAGGGAHALVNAYREFGHRIARLDPLGEDVDSEPLLELGAVGLTEADLDRPVDPRPFKGEFRGTLRELIEALRETYSGPIGVEFVDIPDAERRDWLATAMESVRNRPPLDVRERERLLELLLTADAFEQFLHARYPGQKRFSLEGGATLVPMLDTLVEEAGARGVELIVVGMPHRGRLNVLAHTLGKPYEKIFGEFEASYVPEEVQGHGDVKYHLGYAGRRETRDGKPVALNLHFNPSHLEFVNPVVLGSLRAKHERWNDLSGDRGIPVLIHGDAAFAGEGVVAESLALAQLPAYQTGGTIHIIVNNQVGFTTSPGDTRLTRHPTDLARVIEAPVLHVNGDRPEACLWAMKLALDYRTRFKRDVFVDLVCYRKHGHNELDDPTFTQPVMYRKIAKHVPASRAYGERLVQGGVLSADRVAEIERGIEARLQGAHARMREIAAQQPADAPRGLWTGLEWVDEDRDVRTAVPYATLERVLDGAGRLPEGFRAHARAARLLEDRVKMLAEDRVDWGCGEVLAFGSLVLEGFHVRLSGQDAGRGTFSHRHAVLHEATDGRRHVPLQHLDPKQGRFDVIDTMLSEAACLGFEYGYSTADPGVLVVWEAQFGDFANVAQVYIDQFLASAESKWRRMSGLVLLLPHGYEGQGPEHSSGRLERFLELCADGNLQVANLTTPAQLFHALRRQLHRKSRKPLVVMSPKSLLRHKLAVSPARDFTDSGFQAVLDDATVADPRAVELVLLTSGKFHYSLLDARAERGATAALVRLEQLYPFPADELAAVLARYPNAKSLRWVQEEPANMGAWRHTRHRLEAMLPAGLELERVSRKAAPTPATGYYALHVEQERALLDRAFDRPSTARTTARRVPAAARAGGNS